MSGCKRGRLPRARVRQLLAVGSASEAEAGQREAFQRELWEGPSTPTGSSEEGAVSGEPSILDVRAEVGTCTIAQLNGTHVCDFPVELRTTVGHAVDRVRAVMRHGVRASFFVHTHVRRAARREEDERMRGPGVEGGG